MHEVSLSVAGHVSVLFLHTRCGIADRPAEAPGVFRENWTPDRVKSHMTLLQRQPPGGGWCERGH